jgi:hypothetical protein
MNDSSKEDARLFAPLRDKSIAALVHAGLSFAVLLPVLFIVYYAWFPGPLFAVQDVARILSMLAGIQLLLGPLLTFVVYRRGKEKLKFDLVVIGLVQLAVLAYGVVAIHSERPRYAVFAVDRYVLLASKDVDFGAAGMEGFDDGEGESLVYAFAELPMGAAFQRFQESVLFGGQPDLERRPETWRPLASSRNAILAAARDYRLLLQLHQDRAAELWETAVSAGLDPDTARYVPLPGKRRDFAALIDPRSAKILAVAHVSPW